MLRSFQYSIVVSLRSTDALATPSTAMVSLLLVPFLNAAIVTAVSFSVGAMDPAMSTHAAMVACIVASTISVVASQSAMDRVRGVVAEVSPYGLLRPALWAGKAGVGLLTGVTTATFLVAVTALTGHGGARVTAVALLAPLVSVPAAVAASMLSLTARDPFTVANLTMWVVPVTAGAIVSTKQYPGVLSTATSVLPGTWSVRPLRNEVPLLLGLAAELCVGIAWLLAAGTMLRRAEGRQRRGLIDAFPI
ncbi:hypothetical protein GCM10027053_12950 [Intrasporangium mesophilum]